MRFKVFDWWDDFRRTDQWRIPNCHRERVCKIDTKPMWVAAVGDDDVWWSEPVHRERMASAGSLEATPASDKYGYWSVFQHREQIHKGDVAAIWVAGEYSGIYAIAEIATDPYETPRDECIREANLKYWTEEEDKDLLNGSWIRVSLRYVKLFTIPRTPFVSRKFARNDPPPL